MSQLPPDPPAPAPVASSAKWQQRLKSAGVTLLSWAVPVVAVFFIFWTVRPFDSPTDDPAEEMSVAWNQSIQKLGIEPLFPPQEDFSVGDVWAVIASYEQDSGETREVNPRESIIGKGVRIGHIKLDELGYQKSDRPVFPATTIEDGKITFPSSTQVPTSAIAAGVELSFVSFPSLDIKRAVNDGASVAEVFGLSASRASTETEIVKIPIAETYAVPALNATIALNGWCTRKENEGMCSDERVRQLIAFTLLNDVYETLNGKYRYRFDIKLITQAYLTRQITFQRVADASLTRGLGDTATGAEKPVEGASGGGNGETGIDSDRSQVVNFALDTITYPRPVVFGFRAVSSAIVPSEPPKEAAP